MQCNGRTQQQSLFVLKTEWSTKTHSLAFVYAEDKDSRPSSHRETNTSPTADSGVSLSIIEAKKNGIRANTKVAESSFESDTKVVTEPSSFESEEGISPTADGGILSSSIIHDAKMKGIQANLKVEVMLDENRPQASKAGTHGPLAHALVKKKTQINTNLNEAEHSFQSKKGVIETVVDETFSLQGSKVDAFGTVDIKNTDEDDTKQDDVSSMAKIRDLQALDFVDCFDGYVADNQSKSCKQACVDKLLTCCVRDKDQFDTYYAACHAFTGKVYNNSCNGAKACESAKIQTVKNGCIGYYTCYVAGMDGGVGNMIDSCHGHKACREMAKHADIASSCKADYACYKQGVAGNMIDSCNNQYACDQMAEHAGITRSCNAKSACFKQEVTGNMIDSCNGYEACWVMGEHADITGSCNEYKACSYQGVFASDMFFCCNYQEECDSVCSPPTTCTVKVSLQVKTLARNNSNILTIHFSFSSF